MKKNKLFGYVMTGALTVGIIGGAGISTYAASTDTGAKSSSEVEQAPNVKASMDEETKTKVQAIMDELKSNLSDLGVELPEHRKGGHGPKGDHKDPFADLDDATKAKVKTILDQERDGTITHDEAQAKLKELGVDFPGPGKGGHGDPFADLDDATKAKVKTILDQERDGTITHDEAQAKLKELGMDFPEKGEHKDPFADLDDATKAKVQALIKDANEKLTAIGVRELPFGK